MKEDMNHLEFGERFCWRILDGLDLELDWEIPTQTEKWGCWWFEDTRESWGVIGFDLVW